MATDPSDPLDPFSASGSATPKPVLISTNSMDDFEAELARRANVPTPKADALMQAEEATIRREVEAVTKILKTVRERGCGFDGRPTRR